MSDTSKAVLLVVGLALGVVLFAIGAITAIPALVALLVIGVVAGGWALWQRRTLHDVERGAPAPLGAPPAP